jgi:transcriptional regulator GlxA family with amidase domain
MANQVAVLFLIYEGYNSLDLVAPVEIFSHEDALKGCGATYRTAIASATENTTATEGVIIKRHHSFEALLADDGRLLASFDILIVVGATGEAVHGPGYSTREVIQAFAQLEGRRSGSLSGRWLVSICSGAIILGSLGLFAGKTVTTHFLSMDNLRETCAAVPGVTEKTTVVRKRWVSAGYTPNGARLLTSGGISCGIDATLWMVSVISSLQGAKNVAAMMDYRWDFPSNTTANTTTEGYDIESEPELLYVM